MLQPIIYCSNHFGVCLGRSFTTDIMDMWMNEIVMLMVVQIGQDGFYMWGQVSAVSCSENPRKEANVTGVVINCTFCGLVSTLHTVEIDKCNSSHTGCKIRWSGDWCYIPERRPKWQWPVILSTELNCVYFRYKVAHSGNWQIWKQIFNAQDCTCKTLGHGHE